jgi:hypothetical protein
VGNHLKMMSEKYYVFVFAVLKVTVTVLKYFSL